MIGTSFQQEILTKLSELGQTYIVGGAVRDAQLKVDCRDLDAVVALSLDELEASLSKWGYQPHRIGVKFPTVSVFKNAERLDLTELSGNPQEDALRRDFTINAIYFNVGTKQLEDPLSGIADLNSGILRACGNAQQRFAEDPVRVLRLVRFALKYGFEIDALTWQEAKKALPELVQTAPERITDEFSKILLLDDVAGGLNLLDELGFFSSFLPELARLKGLEQNRYHTKDAWQHTLHVVSNTPAQLLIRLAGLFHDLGKWETASRECCVRGKLEYRKNGFQLDEFQIKGKKLERFKNKYVEIRGARLDNYPETIQVKRIKTTVPGEKEFEWVPDGKRHFIGHERESGCLVKKILPRFRWSMFLNAPQRNGEAELIYLTEHHMKGSLLFMNELMGSFTPENLRNKARKFAWESGWDGRQYSAERVENLLTLWRADFFGGKQRDAGDYQRFEIIQAEINKSRNQIIELLDQFDWTALYSFARQKDLSGELLGRFKEYLRRKIIVDNLNVNLEFDFLEKQFYQFKLLHKKSANKRLSNV
ncbi:MAG: CCA tRNA nucleotidyltransferase [Desulfitobacteriaceae bacterium]|nr:CCA tRNA nucleotidyltransferase [Desulfitobacteriaceae bacterium]MDD4346975.1 CCA tRNA nucleotidyltransferase [Desulfitobacteriaceae bacterium]MDD4401136.1 CCA tRNA nucleotidyltransferase [Desulfitobacteriaceae bacterium]